MISDVSPIEIADDKNVVRIQELLPKVNLILIEITGVKKHRKGCVVVSKTVKDVGVCSGIATPIT
jgi:hypothetical protein